MFCHHQNCLHHLLCISTGQWMLCTTFAGRNKLQPFSFFYNFRYTDEPFTSYMPEALFNISRYLMHELLSNHPKGVSKFAVYYALAKQSRNLGAYKLGRHVLEKIQGLVVPKRFRENVDLATLMIRYLS